MDEHTLIAGIDKMLADRHSPLQGYGNYLVVLARYHGIALTLALGIARAETSFATDIPPADLQGHNAWGYGHPPGAAHGWQFDSWPDSISAVTEFLAGHYVYKGLDTVEKVCPVWVGEHSPMWVKNVSATMTEFGGSPEHLARAKLARPI